MRRKRQNRISLSSTPLYIEPLENRALLAGVTSNYQLEGGHLVRAGMAQIPHITSALEGDNEVTLVADLNTSAFRPQLSLDNGTSWRDSYSNQNYYRLENLRNGFSYKFRLKDNSNPYHISNTISAKPRDITASTVLVPTNIQVIPGDQQWTVSWDVPTGIAQSITGYTIQVMEYRQSAGRIYQDADNLYSLGPTFTFGGSLSAQQVTISNALYTNLNAMMPLDSRYPANPITNGVEYIFNIQLKSGITEGRFSNGIKVTPGSGTVPTAPKNVTKQTDNGNVVLSWEQPSEIGSSSITEYKIGYRNPGGSNPYVFQSVSGFSRSQTFVGHAAFGYEYIIVTKNSIGLSGATEAHHFTETTPTAPRNLQAVAGNGEVALSWDTPLSNGGAAITQYEISYRANTDSEWALLYGTGTSATLPGFINGVTYQFAVSAQNSVGWSEYSNVVTATPYVPINNSPSLSVLNDIFIHEDSNTTVSLTGITVGNDGNQSLRVTSVSSNTGLLPSPTVTYTPTSTTGSLAFAPVANQQGTATITVTVENGGLDDNLSTVGDNRTVQRSFQVTVLEIIAFANLHVLAKDSSTNLYVDTKPVTYNQQQVPQEFFGSTVIGAETVDSQNFLLLKPSGTQDNQPTHRLLTDNTWRINGIFNALQNESSPILEISGREVSDALKIATVSGAYEINGVNNPTLIVRRGQTYTLNLNVAGHPFYLQTTGSGYQSANAYSGGFTGNGQTSGEHQWVVPEDAPDEIFYQCEFHPVMFGKIVVID